MPKSKKKATTSSESLEGTTFEEALEKLEGIVEELEGGRMALEELVSHYEEGTHLLRFCQNSLRSARQRVEAIDPSAARRGTAQLSIMDEAELGENPPAEAANPHSQEDDDDELF